MYNIKDMLSRCQTTDFCHSTLMTPIGKLFIICSKTGLYSISFSAFKNFKTSSIESPQPIGSALMKQVKKELEEYFSGSRRQWDIPIDWGDAKGFYLRVRKACMQIPYGKTISYKELAKLAGSARAARAVGTAMSTNPLSVVVPCHRVIRVEGTLGNYGGGLDTKAWILRHENSFIGLKGKSPKT